MPNHVTNRLRIIASEDKVNEVLEFLDHGRSLCQGEVIDFNTIIKEPDTPHDWYTWRKICWGTKWNAYESHRENGNEIWFKTAWNAPCELMKILATMFQDVTFEHAWADEDTAYNVGREKFVDNSSIDVLWMIEKYHPTEGSKEAFELAFELNPDKREYFVLDEETNNYEYIDD